MHGALSVSGRARVRGAVSVSCPLSRPFRRTHPTHICCPRPLPGREVQVHRAQLRLAPVCTHLAGNRDHKDVSVLIPHTQPALGDHSQSLILPTVPYMGACHVAKAVLRHPLPFAANRWAHKISLQGGSLRVLEGLDARGGQAQAAQQGGGAGLTQHQGHPGGAPGRREPAPQAS